MIEKRKFLRLKTFLGATYEVLGKAPVRTKSILRNLSKGGLRLSSKNALPQGSYVQLEINIPSNGMPVSAFAKVVWTAKTKYCYDAGVRFTKIQKYDRARLLSYAYNGWKEAKDEEV